MRNNRVPDRVLFISLFLAGLVFLFAPQELTSKLQFAYIRVFCWPLSSGRDISISAYGFMASAEGAPQDVVSRARYDKLRNRLANVTEWLKQERQKVETLSGLRNRTVWQGVKFVLADIITSTIDGLHSELIINRGNEDGLAVGQFVMADESIIGTICKVDTCTARVRLMTDPSSQIVVKIEGLNKDRILQGTGGDCAKVKLLPTKYKVEIDVAVYSQKKPGFLSTPVILGTVTQCESNKDYPLLWDITVKPACDLENLTDVSVIVVNPR